jgi:manganese/zinc/iron transport system permease protein
MASLLFGMPMTLTLLFDALFLQLGYNAALVAIGATALGVAAGAIGSFLVLRKRALVADAISHATLPGVAIAFLVMVAFGGEGRNLAGLLAGSAVSAWLGLLCVQWLTLHTRLNEDAAIGAVLSVFFGFGIVLLTVIQNVPAGRQAGLEGFLLGSTAGMLRSDALLIAIGGSLVLVCAIALRRPLRLVAFDPGFARSQGIPVQRMDFLLMALILAITVVGLKIVGLILIVALLIVPPVSARFWTDSASAMTGLAALFGGVSAYVGAALSATAPDLPTGPIIVLTGFAVFLVSMLAAPNRGIIAAILRHRRHQRKVHMRQGLMALAQGQPIYEGLTLRMLRNAGLIRRDRVPTEAGRAAASAIWRDELRWQAVRRSQTLYELSLQDDGLTPVDQVLTTDQIAEIDARLARLREVSA